MFELAGDYLEAGLAYCSDRGRDTWRLYLLAGGLRNAQIAQRLVVSEKTVHHHVSAVLRKLNARTRGEASAEALRLGLLDKAYVMAPSRPSGAATADDQD
jgi:DNA-binding CsgD family transcriptional regulator